MRLTRALVLAASALAARVASPRAIEAQDTATSGGIVTTRHSITVGGKVLRYTARAGLIPIRDTDAGDVHGNMFFVSYTLDQAAGLPARPLTFLWNGGPGSNAGLVHLLGFGPKRVAPATGAAPRLSPAGTTLIANDGTWLDHTDLVFVDPVGTGYSRPSRPEYAAEFYQSRGDAESVAEFIRVYRTRYDAFDAPLFIMGESYGVTRAALVADALERRGTSLAGVIMLGLALPLGDIPAPMRIALGVPTFTAAAFANRKLPADLQPDLQAALRASAQWAENEYAPALARRDSLAAEQRDAIAAQLARFTGLPVANIDRKTLRVTMEQLANTLLASEHRVIGHYDSRMTGPRDTAQQMYDPTKDPSLKDILDGTSVIRYLRGEIGFKSDLFYQGPFGGGYPPPTAFRGDWMSVRWNRAIQPNPAALRTAMTANPNLHVLIACGFFDLVCDHYGNEYAARHLPPEFAPRVTARSYAGGHAVYTDDRARLDLKRDVRAFIEARAAAARAQDSAIVVTRHQVVLGGKPLAYTARAAFIPIRDNETGAVHGNVFFVAYTVPVNPGEPPRPLTFAWNGGPGSNSTLVHLSGFGPRRIRAVDDPAVPAVVEPVIEDNQETWLAFTDLVFVDPIGTGFSRPAKPEYAAEFYSTLGDIASIAEFVRAYRTQFDALMAPLFLAGESYGVWRTGGVAEALEARGQKVARVILISGGIPFGPVASDAVRTALFVPNRTATALYHQKLATELQSDAKRTLSNAGSWALETYAPALARRDQLDDAERDSIVAGLARFTGVVAAAIDRKTLAMTSPQFTAALLRDRQLTLGRYDMRLTGAQTAPNRATVIARYLRGELGFKSDLAYQGVESGYTASGNATSVGARWNWNQAPPGAPVASAGSGDGPPGGSQPWLRRAMTLNPDLKAFVAAGLYDSLNSCADNNYIIAHIEPAFSRNFSSGCYAGGHMMYDVTAARRELRRGVAAFILASTSTARRP